MSSAQCQAVKNSQRCVRRAAHNYNENSPHHDSGMHGWTDDEPDTISHPQDHITRALNMAERLLVQDEYERGKGLTYAQLIAGRDIEALIIEQARTQHRKNNGA